MPTVKLAPSILTADFGRLADEVRAAEAGGADLLHLDIMDGQFVPNITFGHTLVAALRKATNLPFDIHLMVVQPDRQVPYYVEYADTVNVHIEAAPHINRVLSEIRRLGAKCGVCLNPGTPVSAIEESLPDLDQVMVMAINPGWGGQQMIPRQLEKVRRIRQLLEHENPRAEVMIDGGVKLSNAGQCVAAGASVLVCGSSVFAPGTDVAENLAALRRAAGQSSSRANPT
jgi:ribulose-phosphate 3-epimerase